MPTPFIDHYIVECFDCPKSVTNNSDTLKKLSDKFIKKLDLHIVNSFTHRFSPHGITLVEILCESHIAYHTWPELNYMIFDVMTCSKIKEGKHLGPLVKKIFKAKKTKITKPIY